MCKEYREHCRCGNSKPIHIELCPKGADLRKQGRPFFHHLPDIVLNPTMRLCPNCDKLPQAPAAMTKAQAVQSNSRRLWAAQPSAQPPAQRNPVTLESIASGAHLQAPSILANPYRYFEGLGPEGERAASPVTAPRSPLFSSQNRVEFAKTLAQLSAAVDGISSTTKPTARTQTRPQAQLQTQTQPHAQPHAPPQPQLPAELSASSIEDLPTAFAKLKARGPTEWAEHMNSAPATGTAGPVPPQEPLAAASSPQEPAPATLVPIIATVPPQAPLPTASGPQEPAPAAPAPIIEKAPPQEPLPAVSGPQEPSPALPAPIIETVAHLAAEEAIEDGDEDGENLTASSTAASELGESCSSLEGSDANVDEEGVLDEAEWEVVKPQELPPPPAEVLRGKGKGDGLGDWEFVRRA
ncbi:uncharacterized protein BDZ99DRAFT_518375 [Mytilinidion resinicola]|uniref:Uncharacterized protein n=1 Tax=Mytilinidion resinicola TaxID=574789 RepID=A0A6A6YX36_9PEZI|nr:uncharacterized protein BDZ99DRAFT_518375 [Mytilinidion resinicola]KAF2812545.1 hypothetical protein BDZ99DRAFT_518375 [Mytilinidion resinicola]